MVENVNIDEKCAEYGFRICDYALEIYNTLNRKLKELQKKDLTDLIKVAKDIYGAVINSLPEDVKNFNNYTKMGVLNNLVKFAERIQSSNISDEEKIEKFTRERNFSDFANECESSLRKVLGILSTEGVFASIVWIESKKEEESYCAIKYQMSKFLHEIFGAEGRFSGDPDKLRDEVLEVCSDIPQMFFIKQILEQMLTYALYRARSLR